MGKQLDYFPAFFKYRGALESLSDDQVGRVFRAALEYAETGNAPRLGSVEKMAFAFIQSDIDVARAKYEARCERNKENAQKRWDSEPDEDAEQDFTGNANACERIRTDAIDAKQTNKQTKQTNNPPSGESMRARTREGSKNQTGRLTVGGPDAANGATHREEPVPPTFEEVYAYCEAEGLTHVNRKRFYDNYAASGWMRNGEPIRDWKALARKWEAEDAQKAADSKPAVQPDTSFETDSFFDAALMRTYGQYAQSAETESSE